VTTTGSKMNVSRGKGNSSLTDGVTNYRVLKIAKEKKKFKSRAEPESILSFRTFTVE
jgi:hypothetical protein